MYFLIQEHWNTLCLVICDSFSNVRCSKFDKSNCGFVFHSKFKEIPDYSGKIFKLECPKSANFMTYIEMEHGLGKPMLIENHILFIFLLTKILKIIA